MNNLYDSIIIGAGPAGLSAAIYLKRANKNILIIEKNAPGGKLLTIGKIENYLGFDSIDGATLAIKMYNQVKNLDVKFKFTEVLEVKKHEYFEIRTQDEIIYSKTIIYATGNQNKKPNIANINKFENKGISYCATCDGTLYKNKNIVVLGSNQKAVEEAIYLSGICKSVNVITENEKLDSVFMMNKLNNYQNIKVSFNTKIKSINGINKVESLTIINSSNEEQINTDAVFIYLGDTPSTYPLSKLNVLNDKGNIEVDESKETKVEGLFGAGDCINKTLRQVSTAVGDGAIAAISALKRM